MEKEGEEEQNVRASKNLLSVIAARRIHAFVSKHLDVADRTYLTMTMTICEMKGN